MTIVGVIAGLAVGAAVTRIAGPYVVARLNRRPASAGRPSSIADAFKSRTSASGETATTQQLREIATEKPKSLLAAVRRRIEGTRAAARRGYHEGVGEARLEYEETKRGLRQ
ncbi:MAG: hypothetical protein GEU28_06335 [Dehalococcoidia bacterium]|nr:hypothetical protein [Dehalococcoidia bacterium]